MNKLIVLMLGVAVVFAGWQFVSKMKGDTTPMKTLGTTDLTQNTDAGDTPVPAASVSAASLQATPALDVSKSYTAVIRTDKGDITVALTAKETPRTVNNFVNLAKKGFYDGTIFHRTIKGFMIQGGDPKGDGTGGPGYKFDDEPFTGEYIRGTIAMANAGPNTNGSQFFIMHQDYRLPKNYVIFGKVTEGLETVDAIAQAPVKIGPSGEESSPVTPVKVTAVDILEE